MRSISVPLSAGLEDTASYPKYVEILRKMGVKRIFLAVGRLNTDEREKKKKISDIKKWAPYFKKEGFEVGVWFWSFLFDGDADFTLIKGVEGDTTKSTRACPFDEKHTSFVISYVEEFIKAGADLILFDDDYRFGHLKVKHKVGCFCQYHMKDIEKRLGEPIARKTLIDNIFLKEPNKYRKAWCESNEDSLITFAKNIREAADKINPNVRIGHCCCYTAWDLDGTTPVKIAKAFAGNTRPFFRITSAPYWLPDRLCDVTLIDVIDFARIQFEWCRGSDVEVMAEGDTYPRGRYYVPASFLELFDTALIADGKMETILKYVFDYTSPYDYEDGYYREHIASNKLYSEIEEIFIDKRDAGVYVYDLPEKTKNSVFPYQNDDDYKNSDYLHLLSFPKASRLLSQYSIPVTYTEKSGVKAIFAEIATKISREELTGGAFLDASSAEYLDSIGIDVGFADKEEKETKSYGEIYYPKRDAIAQIRDGAIVLPKEVKPEANVLVYVIEGDKKQPLIYTYENKEGERFLVTLLDTRKTARAAGKCPYIQEALIDGLEEVGKKPLPAVSKNNPELYIITKEGDGKIAVGLWNIFADKLLNKEITLPSEIESVKFINGEGSFEGNKVYIKNLPAFSMMAFEATLKK